MTITPNIPIVNAGLLYVNGLTLGLGVINADALSSATLVVGIGSCRNSTDTNDISLTAAATLNTAVSGAVNGLDQGALAATTKYAVYVIGDSTEYNATGTLLSTSFSQPLLPVGYDMFRRIGMVMSNAAGTRILNFHQRGNGSVRPTYYAVPFATLITAGASATFADVILTTWVPISYQGRVYILSALTADAGGTRTVVYSADRTTTIAAAATAGEVIESSPASTVTSASLVVPYSVAAGVATIQYAVSNASAQVAVSVQGFEDQL